MSTVVKKATKAQLAMAENMMKMQAEEQAGMMIYAQLGAKKLIKKSDGISPADIVAIINPGTNSKVLQAAIKKFPKPALAYMASHFHVHEIPKSAYMGEASSSIGPVAKKPAKKKPVPKKPAVKKTAVVTADLVSLDAASVLARFKQENPKVELVRINWQAESIGKEKNLQWKSKKLNKQQAVQIVHEAILRFEHNIIPHEVKPHISPRFISLDFLAIGLSSALDIVDKYTPQTFIESFSELFARVFPDNSELVEKAYNNALDIRSRILLHYMNIQGATQSHYSVTPWSVDKDAVDHKLGDLPSYQSLFGKDVYVDINHDNSVLSPAAYLSELKAAIDKNIEHNNNANTIDQRRPDIDNLLLSKDNTSKEVDKLEIVNKILETKLGEFDGVAYEKLATGCYPMSQPYMLPLQQSKAYLDLLGSDLDTLWRTCTFSTVEKNHTYANYIAEESFYARSFSLHDFKSLFMLELEAVKAQGDAKLYSADVANISKQLDITYQDIDALISADLSEEDSSKGLGKRLYINLDENIPAVQVLPVVQKVTNLTLLRLNKLVKLVKLHKMSGIAIADLQVILQAFSLQEKISTSDASFLIRADFYITQLQKFQKQFNISLDEALGLVGFMRNTAGKSGVSFLQQIFPDLLQKSFDSKAEDDANSQLRYALIGALGVADPDFSYMLSFVKEQFIQAGSASMGGTQYAGSELALIPATDSAEIPAKGKSMIVIKQGNASFGIRLFDKQGKSLDWSGNLGNLPMQLAQLIKDVFDNHAVSDNLKQALMNKLIAYFDNTPITLDEQVLSALYRFAKLINVLNISFFDALMLLETAQGSTFAGPQQHALAFCGIVSSASDVHAWLTQRNWSPMALNYLLNGQFGDHFGDLDQSTCMQLQTSINNDVAHYLVSDSVASVAIEYALKVITASTPTAKIEYGKEDLTGEQLRAWLTEMRVISQSVLSGVVLRIPGTQELLGLFNGNKLVFTDVDKKALNSAALCLAQKIRDILIYCQQRQQSTMIATLVKFFKVDQAFVESFAAWPAYVLSSVSLAYIVGEESNVDRKAAYFNAINRFQKLIGALQLKVADIDQLLQKFSVFKLGDFSDINPLLSFADIKEMAFMPALQKQFNDQQGNLYQYQNQHDSQALTNLAAWAADDVDAILQHWQLDTVSVQQDAKDKVFPALFKNDGATSIAAYGQYIVMGYADYNEIVVLQKSGDEWLPTILRGAEGGSLGVAVSMHNGLVLAVDANNQTTHVYQKSSDSWVETNTINHDKAPGSIAVNAQYVAISVDSNIDIYLLSDISKAASAGQIAKSQSIAAKNGVKQVFLDQSVLSNCGYSDDDSAYVVHDLLTAKETTLEIKGKASGLAALGGEVFINPGVAGSIKLSCAKSLSLPKSAKSFDTLAAADISSTTIKYAGKNILDMSYQDGVLYLLTNEEVIRIDILLSKLFETPTFSLVDKLGQVFALANQTGAPVAQILNLSKLINGGTYSQWEEAAQKLENIAKAKYQAEDWSVVAKPVLTKIQQEKRDVLVDALLYNFAKTPGYQHITNRELLSEYLLIDVDVTSLVTTSYVKEAISALQLYIYRCQMNIEDGTRVNSDFHEYWQWLRSYSVWEANRMVFLYPENYLEPDLRKERTPLFDDFSAFLKRNKVSEEHINTAYKQYLDGFLSLANLEIVNVRIHNNSNRGNKDDGKQLVIIGRTTESDGYKYYFRIANFKKNERLKADVPDDWGTWQEIETKIPTKWITPVNAFGRLYLFWVELKPYSGTDKDKKGTSTAILKCCFYNYRGKWSIQQTLVDDINVKAAPDSAADRDNKVYHTLNVDNSGNVITFTYIDESSKQKHTYHLDPHMKVSADKVASLLKPIVTIPNDKTKYDAGKGFLGLQGACKTTQKKGVGVTCPANDHLTITAWVKTPAAFSGTESLLQLGTLSSGMHFGIATRAEKNKQARLLIDQNNLQHFSDCQYQLSPNTWYYFALQLTRDASRLTDTGCIYYRFTKFGVIEGSVKNNQLVGTKPQYVPCRGVIQQAFFPTVKGAFAALPSAIRKQEFKAIAMRIRQDQYTISFRTGEVHNVQVYNTLLPTHEMASTSGASFSDIPEVHVGKKDIHCCYVPNSDQRMILMKSGNTSYLVVNDANMQYQYVHRLTTSVATQFDNIYSQHVDGISSLLSTATQNTSEAAFTALLPDASKIPELYWPEDTFVDLEGADGIYYWELFFYVPWMLARSYSSNNQYESAKKWFEYIFNPLVKARPSKVSSVDANDHFWSFVGMKVANNPTLRFEHFANASFELIEEISDNINLQPSWDMHLPAVKKYHDDPFDPHAIARLRPIAYQKAIFKDYVNNMINWADDFYRQNTRETLEEAYMLYTVTTDLLGKKPLDVGESPAPTPQSLKQLDTVSGSTSEFLLGIENSLSHTGPINVQAVDTPNNQISSSYFGIPENKQFIGLWDTVDNRLYNLRHQLTIDGQPNSLPLFQPPANPMALISAAASGSAGAQGYTTPQVAIPAYRYSTISNKAQQFVNYVTRFGSELQGAMRSKDAAVITKLRATQQVEIMKMMDDIKRSSIQIAQDQLDSAKLSLASTTYRRDYYDTLLHDGIGKKSGDVNRFKAALGLKDTGVVLTELAAEYMAGSAALMFVKMVTGPFSGLVFGMADGGSDEAAAIDGASHAMGQTGFAAQTQAGVLEQMAGQLEQAQNYYLTKKEAEDQIGEINKRINIAKERLASAQKQYEIYQTQLTQEQQVQKFYEDNFLDEQLYAWMIQQLTMLYKQAYGMAHQLALECQRCWQYEIGDDKTNFIGGAYWQDAYRGFLAGESLQADLLRMDKAYLDRNERSLEIVKYVSLAETDPMAFLTLVQTGSCHINLNEKLFNADYPGHYMRRIKSVSFSLGLQSQSRPSSVNATLTQVGNKVVLEPNVDVVNYLQTGKTSKGESELDALTAEKLRVDICNNQHIATSSANNDAGLFNVSFDYDQRYLPFEGTGAISDWHLEMGLNENPKLCASLGEALSITAFISNLTVAQLIDFVKDLQSNAQMAGAFHKEVMARLNSNISMPDLGAFVTAMMADKALHTWFNNLGNKNLTVIEQALGKSDQKTIAGKLKAYLQTAKVPDDMQDSPLSATTVLNITDVTLKVSYTAKSGGADFKQKVQAL